jgi:hypothetical protein
MNPSAPEQYLSDALSQLEPSLSRLEDSFEFCRFLAGKESFTRTEMVEAEAFTSRFARTSDILVKQVFRALDTLELEESGSIIDLLNRALKRGLVADEETARRIRRVRNEIAHEYRIKDFPSLLGEILSLTPALSDMCRRTLSYANKLTLS